MTDVRKRSKSEMHAAPDPPHPIFSERTAGVLLHPTSLPGPHGIGDLGIAAHRFINWLRRAGMTWWQMLPVGPIGAAESPYSSASSFAGEPLFISLHMLARDGLLKRSALTASASLKRAQGGLGAPSSQRPRTEYQAAREYKMPRLDDAHKVFAAREGFSSPAFRAFARAARGWLPDWLEYRQESGRGLEAFIQFAFQSQWLELRARAQSAGIRLLGDLPIFVASDSADVAAHPELFRLDRRGNPTVLTGVPPDDFSKQGQLWGHPHYRWREHQRTDFRWWIDRVRWTLTRFDAVRIDHFIGLCRAWEVPGAARTARLGKWGSAPGEQLLCALAAQLGPLPLVAEDLGAHTPAVMKLRAQFGLPGMKIVQWGFGHPKSTELPCHHPAHTVAYPGTHDNDTAIGWWAALPACARKRAQRYARSAFARPARTLTRLTLSSPARLSIIPMQDLLELPSEARMNLPGTVLGNWTFRLGAGDPSETNARIVRRLVDDSWRSIRMDR